MLHFNNGSQQNYSKSPECLLVVCLDCLGLLLLYLNLIAEKLKTIPTIWPQNKNFDNLIKMCNFYMNVRVCVCEYFFRKASVYGNDLWCCLFYEN